MERNSIRKKKSIIKTLSFFKQIFIFKKFKFKLEKKTEKFSLINQQQ